jgi:ATP-binding cassette, subfamily B (MDR/TAP), member 1
MGFESVFLERFNQSTEKALRTGVRGAFVEGCTYGVASSLIYLSEALLFFAGAVLVSQGTYTYLQMVQVLNLVIFSVSIASQMMTFSMSFIISSPRIVLTAFISSAPHCQVSAGNTRLQSAS